MLKITYNEFIKELENEKTSIERRKLLWSRLQNELIDSENNVLNSEKKLFESEKNALKNYNDMVSFAKKTKTSLKELGIEPFRQRSDYLIDTSRLKRIYVPLTESITLSPFLSLDYDTPKNLLKYSWRYWGTDEILFSKDFISEISTGECKVTLFSKKSSTWELTVSDGVTESKDTVIIIPQTKKILFIPQQERSFLIYRQQSLFRQKESKIFNIV